MQSGDLVFFAAVAKAGSIGRAAQSLHTVQSNVTNRIIALERTLGTPLFHRSSRGVTLTPAGARLLPYATQVLQLLARAVHAVASDDGLAGPLRIGSLETTAALRLPPLLSAFARSHPDLDIELETGPTQVLVERVLDRTLEGAFVSGPVNHGQLTAVPILREELVIVAPPDIDDAAKLAALLSGGHRTKALVFRNGCSYRQRFEGYLASQGLAYVRCIEFGTLDGIIGCVEAGMGLTMVPRIVAEPARRQGRVSIHSLADRAGLVSTVFIHRADHYPTGAFTRFLDAAIRTFEGGTEAAPCDGTGKARLAMERTPLPYLQLA